MAINGEATDSQIDVGKIPLIDLRSFCQDEICSVAQFFGNHQDDKSNFVISSAINKSIFNESSGSRKQTYERHRASRRTEEAHSTFHGKTRVFEVCETLDKGLPLVAGAENCFAVTDVEENQWGRENQELIDLICKEMQKHAHVQFPGKSYISEPTMGRLDIVRSIEGCAEPVFNVSIYGDHLHQVCVNTESVNGNIAPISQGNLFAGMELAGNDCFAHDRNADVQMEHKEVSGVNDAGQLVVLEQSTSNLRLNDSSMNSYRHFNDNHTVRDERGFYSDSLEQKTGAGQLKLLNENVSNKLSRRMRTKEGARRRSTMGEAEIAQLTLKRFCGMEDDSDKRLLYKSSSKGSKSVRFSQVDKQIEVEALKKDRDDIKMIDAEGLRSGWKGSVRMKKDSGQASAGSLKYVSPDGQEWHSHRGTLANVGSTFGQAVLMRMTIPEEHSEVVVTSETTSKGFLTELPEAASPRNIIYKPGLNQNGIYGKAPLPLCLTCQATFANKFSLQRHLKRTKHKGWFCDAKKLFKNCTKICHSPSAGTSNIKYLDSRRSRMKNNSSLLRESAEDIHYRIGFTVSRDCDSFKAEEPNLKDLSKELEACKEVEKPGKNVREAIDHLQNSTLKHSSGDQGGSEENCGLDKCKQESLNHIHESVATCEGMSNVTPSTNAEKDSFKCHKCYKIFDTARKRLGHLASHARSAFECQHCHKIFYKHRTYLDHLNGHSRNLRKEVAGSSSIDDQKVHQGGLSGHTFVCEKCGKAFSQRKKYLGHQIVHSKKLKERRCPVLRRPSRLVDDGKRRTEIHTNLSKFVCKHCGKAFDQRRKFMSHLNAHPRTKQKTCNGIFESKVTRNKPMKVSTSSMEQSNGFITAADTVPNKMQMVTSSTVQSLLFTSAQSGQQFRASSGVDFNAYKGEQVKDGLETSLFSSPDSETVELDRLLAQTAGILQGADEQLVAMEEMKCLGWSAEGCFICRQAGGDSTELVVCLWCEREFHWSCLTNALLVFSGGWVCPFCKTVSKSCHN